MITGTITVTTNNQSQAGSTATPAGPPGLSAFQVAQANGFSGSQSQWLASLVGPPGPTGPTPSGVLLTANSLAELTATAATARSNLGAAPLASPALTGTPTAPTAGTGTSTTQIGTTAFTANAISALQSRTDIGGLNFSQGTGASATRAAVVKARERVSLDDFSGATDIIKLQAAHDFLGAQGGVIELPARDITLDTSTGQVSITNPVTLRGRGWSETSTVSAGTRFVLPDASQSPFVVTGGGVAGFTVEKLSIFQSAHPTPASGWAPTAYPVVFSASNMTGPIIFRDILGQAVRALIDMNNVGRPEFYDVRGHWFDYCFSIDQCLDSAEISHVRGWPYWSQSPYVWAYTQSHCMLIKLYRCDTPFIRSLFNIFGKCVVFFGDNGNGICTGFKIAEIDSDTSTAGIIIDSSCDGTHGTVKGYISVLRHVGIIYNQGSGTTYAVAGSGTIIDNGTYVHLYIGYVESEFTDKAIQQNGAGGALYIDKADITYWSHASGVTNSTAVYQHNTSGSNPNKAYFGNRPFLANDINGTLQNSSTDGVIEGFPVQLWYPTFSASSGTFASQPTVNGAIFSRMSGYVYCTLDFTITSACIGTAAGTLSVSLPYTNGTYSAVALGEEAAVAGTPVFGRMGPNTSAILLQNVSNTTVIQANYRIYLQFSYLAQSS